MPVGPEFPASLGPNTLFYHYYDVQRDLGCADLNGVTQGLINNPTPGTPSPATPNGTPNNASLAGFNNPITSYLTTDVNRGAQLVVNKTERYLESDSLLGGALLDLQLCE